jgi:hypothetical protein
MQTEFLFNKPTLSGPKCRERRSINISAKLTPTESAAIQTAAAQAGLLPGEWARKTLLQATGIEGHDGMEMHIFAECVGIQMLLMGTMEPLLRQAGLSEEKVTSIFREAQTTKQSKAQELIARRVARQQEQAAQEFAKQSARDSNAPMTFPG